MPMNSLLEDAICGAIGYAVGMHLTKGDSPSAIEQYMKQTTLSDCVHEFARAHDIYLRSNTLAAELRRLADEFEDPYAL